jgi:hypothetical protein
MRFTVVALATLLLLVSGWAFAAAEKTEVESNNQSDSGSSTTAADYDEDC